MKRYFLPLALALSLPACGRGYSEGQRSGTIVKFSNKGFVCKTHEGIMNLGGLTTDANGAAVANTWEFSIVDEALVPKIVEAMDAHRPVTLVYQQWMWAPGCFTPGPAMDSDYEVVGLK